MTPDDLAALHGACFTTPRPWRADEFATLLASPLVALIAEPGGFALVRIIADEAELLTIAVQPDLRRKGLGARLLSAALDQTAKRGAVSMFLEVAATNQPALALYQRAGFRPVGRRPGYYIGPDARDDALILRRDQGPVPDPTA